MMSVRTVPAAHSFVAGPELPPVPSVRRVSEMPLTDTVASAFTMVAPVTAERSVIEQLPVPPVVMHGDAVVNAPGPDTIVKPINVPSGAFTRPEPLLTFTCAVNVCAEPTGFVALGPTWMFASTTRSGSHGPSEAVYVASPA